MERLSLKNYRRDYKRGGRIGGRAKGSKTTWREEESLDVIGRLKRERTYAEKKRPKWGGTGGSRVGTKSSAGESGNFSRMRERGEVNQRSRAQLHAHLRKPEGGNDVELK